MSDHTVSVVRADVADARHSDLLTYISDLEQRVTALEEAGDPDPDPDPSSSPLIGLGPGWNSAYSTWPQVINAAQDLVDRPMHIRRTFNGNLPSSYNQSSLRHDSDIRPLAWSFKPPASVTVSQVENLLSSVPVADRATIYVTPWHEPRNDMSASAYLSRYAICREAYENVGGFAGMGPILIPWGINTQNELDYLPSDGVDFLGIDPYVDLEQSYGVKPWDYSPATIDAAVNRDIPLNVGEFGVGAAQNSQHLAAQVQWLLDWKDLPNYTKTDWMCYWHDEVSGLDCRLQNNDPAVLTAYRELIDHFHS